MLFYVGTFVLKERTNIEGIWELRFKENIWSSERFNNRRIEKITE
jgi:hypothetical protein